MSWQSKYHQALNTPPVGQELMTKNGCNIKIITDYIEGKPPFVFAIAYVNDVVGEQPLWVFQHEGETRSQGWKAILLPRARQVYLRDPKPIYRLRVVRVSETGKSLLVELI